MNVSSLLIPNLACLNLHTASSSWLIKVLMALAIKIRCPIIRLIFKNITENMFRQNKRPCCIISGYTGTTKLMKDCCIHRFLKDFKCSILIKKKKSKLSYVSFYIYIYKNFFKSELWELSSGKWMYGYCVWSSCCVIPVKIHTALSILSNSQSRAPMCHSRLWNLKSS